MPGGGRSQKALVASSRVDSTSKCTTKSTNRKDTHRDQGTVLSLVQQRHSGAAGDPLGQGTRRRDAARGGTQIALSAEFDSGLNGGGGSQILINIIISVIYHR